MSNGVVEGVAHGTGSCIGLCVVGPIVLVIGAIAIFWGIPRFSDAYSDASAGDKMVEAPRVLSSFEVAYLTVSVEKGNNANITEKELNFKAPDDSKFFKYEYVTYPQGGIAGYKATALKNMGKFNEGHFLQTVYQKDSDSFTHCVGGNGSDVDVVKELIPKFKATVGCSSVEIKKPSGTAPAQQNNTGSAPAESRDSRLVNADGWCWYSTTTTYSLTFKSNGTASRTHIAELYEEGYTTAAKGTWSTNGNKITLILDGARETFTYSISGTTLYLDNEKYTKMKEGDITYEYD